MKTIKQVDIIPLFLDDYLPEKNQMKENEIYISREFHTAIHLCLCGCKNLVVTPFNKDGWNIESWDGKVSISPSIGNYSFPCKSHYIITKNKANFV